LDNKNDGVDEFLFFQDQQDIQDSGSYKDASFEQQTFSLSDEAIRMRTGEDLNRKLMRGDMDGAVNMLFWE
jgi:hypothetical protein